MLRNKKRNGVSIILVSILIIVAGVFGGCAKNKEESLFEQYMEMSRKNLSSGDYESALVALEKAKGIEPSNEEVYYSIADVHTKMNNYEEAVKVLDEGILETGAEALNAYKKELEKAWNNKESKDEQEFISVDSSTKTEEQFTENATVSDERENNHDVSNSEKSGDSNKTEYEEMVYAADNSYVINKYSPITKKQIMQIQYNSSGIMVGYKRYTYAGDDYEVIQEYDAEDRRIKSIEGKKAISDGIPTFVSFFDPDMNNGEFIKRECYDQNGNVYKLIERFFDDKKHIIREKYTYYDEAGEIIRIEEERTDGYTSVTQYYKSGKYNVSEIDIDGTQISTDYNADGTTGYKKKVNADGSICETIYDESGTRRIYETTTDGQKLTTHYNASGVVAYQKQENADGSKKELFIEKDGTSTLTEIKVNGDKLIIGYYTSGAVAYQREERADGSVFETSYREDGTISRTFILESSGKLYVTLYNPDGSVQLATEN